MSFVPAGPAKVEAAQDLVMSCITCPVKALVKEGSTYYCTHNFNISKNTISKTSLGDVPTDVIKNCTSCTLYKENKIEDVAIEVVKSRVACPMLDTSNSVKDCGKCMCLAVEKTRTHLEGKDKDAPIDKIFCTFPNIDLKSIGVSFTPSKKKIVKTSIEQIRSSSKEVK